MTDNLKWVYSNNIALMKMTITSKTAKTVDLWVRNSSGGAAECDDNCESLCENEKIVIVELTHRKFCVLQNNFSIRRFS